MSQSEEARSMLWSAQVQTLMASNNKGLCLTLHISQSVVWDFSETVPILGPRVQSSNHLNHCWMCGWGRRSTARPAWLSTVPSRMTHTTSTHGSSARACPKAVPRSDRPGRKLLPQGSLKNAFFFFLNSSKVNIQCYTSFKCTTQWFNHSVPHPVLIVTGELLVPFTSFPIPQPVTPLGTTGLLARNFID